MSESIHEPSTHSEAAQRFLYAPPSGEGSQNLAGTPSWPGPNAQESVLEHSSSEQTVQKAYEKGFAEGKANARAEFEQATAELRSQISGALRAFSKDRTDYFERVEVDIVRLSLSMSIARKILHRESQIDPLVLTGVVHVALKKLNSNTSVRLLTHPEEVHFWSEYFRQAKDISSIVEVVSDPTLAQRQCTLETDFGSTQIRWRNKSVKKFLTGN